MEKRNNGRDSLLNRKPFQGVLNVVRFNWPLYLFALFGLVSMLILSVYFSGILRLLLRLASLMVALPVLASLLVTVYIYDLAGIYNLRWIENKNKIPGDRLKILNINAGFDEISEKLQFMFPTGELTILDFYNPNLHTEVSILRARKAYPPHKETIGGHYNNIPLKPDGYNLIMLFFAAHEIRSEQEKVIFFKTLKAALAKDGEIYMVEHLRDWPNFMAYTIGFLHFASPKTWLNTFQAAGITLTAETKYTPFLSVYRLR